LPERQMKIYLNSHVLHLLIPSLSGCSKAPMPCVVVIVAGK
jgi:hypothetical protein